MINEDNFTKYLNSMQESLQNYYLLAVLSSFALINYKKSKLKKKLMPQ